MFGNHFYYRTLRRNVIAFGNLFNNIQLVRYAKDTFNEINRITVPLSYANKEDFIKRLYDNPDLHKPVQIVLPRISINITDISYDATRKISTFSSNFSRNTTNNSLVNQQYVGVPYDITFELSIYVRNVEDGTQIVEQILPYFTPDYTLAMNFVDQMNISKDIPIILQSIEQNIQSDGIAETTTRTIIWTLTFKMKSFFFGPTNSGKLIRNVIVGSSNSSSFVEFPGSTLYINTGAGIGNYQLQEIVYQGRNLPEATAIGTVTGWAQTTNKIIVTMQDGRFVSNVNVIGALSAASRLTLNVSPITTPSVTINTIPNPTSANLNQDFGFTETITEHG